MDENEELSASGDVRCGILGWIFLEKESALGRAAVQSVNGAIPAHLYRFNPDEPENKDYLARSLFVQSKHARDKSRGLWR